MIASRTPCRNSLPVAATNIILFAIISASFFTTTSASRRNKNQFYDLSSMEENQKLKLLQQTSALMESNLTKVTIDKWKSKANYHELEYPSDLFSDPDFEGEDVDDAVDFRQRRLRHVVKYRDGRPQNYNNPSRRHDKTVISRSGGRKIYDHSSGRKMKSSKKSSKSKGKGYSSGGSSVQRVDPFEEYTYNKGNCPNAGSQNVPCAPDNLRETCNKYDRINGSFKACYEACQPSFCCAHDAKDNYLAEPCQQDENCAQYSWCYIVWWKLHDTIGPAIYILIEQNDDFFDLPVSEIEGDKTGDTFWNQVILHHFDDIESIIDYEETVNGEFNTKNVFDNPDYWRDGKPPDMQ